jgi:ParB family transcriptional regulator, chromosome partitioning protein
MPSEKVISVKIADITLRHRIRELDDKVVRRLMASIRDQGLRSPIHLFRLDHPKDSYGIAAGHHRLEAMIRLGFTSIPAFVLTKQEAAAWQESENIDRSELKILERSEGIVRYKLARLRLPRVNSSVSKGGRQPNDKGYSQLAKRLGCERRCCSAQFWKIRSSKSRFVVTTATELDCYFPRYLKCGR